MDREGQEPLVSTSPNPSSIEIEQVRSPQVCDRCRAKKIGCDAALPSCGNCISVKSRCLRTQNLRRKTKPRRYVEPKDDIIKKLKAEVQTLRSELQATNLAHTRASDNYSQQSRQRSISKQPDSRQNPFVRPGNTPNLSPRHVRDSQTVLRPDCVFKHIGRLVRTASGVDRFAGSATGVHFIHSAEQKYLQISNTAKVFDENVYKLHTLSQPMSLYGRNQPSIDDIEHRPPSLELPKAKPYYLLKIERFFRRWGSTYPVLSHKQFYDGVHKILDHTHEFIPQMSNEDMSCLSQLYLILAINTWDDPRSKNDLSTDNAPYYFRLARQTHLQSIEQGDLPALQALLLMSLFLQLSGQHSLLIQVSGEAVRLAQSLGLHRHTRRFKFCAGEVEMRNRIWWAVYRLDTIVSISHGLPTIIKEADVDTALPLDCDFDDIASTILPLPLPGETTRLSIFLCEIRLIRITCSCLHQLYTTTERRGGTDKISALDRELRVWQSNFSAMFCTENPEQYLHDDQEFTTPSLQLMSNFCMFLIHLPALTFDPEVPPFAQSLNACVHACRNIIEIFSTNKNERRLFYLQPNGARLTFQSAMLCLYESWHMKASKEPEHRTGEQDGFSDAVLKDTINSAISLLELQSSEYLKTGLSGLHGKNSASSEILQVAISTLRRLAPPARSTSTMDLVTISDSPVGEPSQHEPPPPASSDESWRLSALDNLNQLDDFEWDFDPAPPELKVMDSNFLDASMLL